MPLLIVVAIVVVCIIIGNQNKQKMYQSDIYQEWYSYYIKSGYSHDQAQSYAASQYKRGDRLSNYNVNLDDVNPANANSSAASLANTAAAPVAKAKDPYAATNWVLAIACFCLIAGLLAMVNELNDSLVAPLFIIVSLALYIGGSAIYSNVKVLKPVGTAFVVSSLILLPFCCISFEEIFGDSQASWLLTTLLCVVCYAAAGILTKIRAFGGLTYVWACLFMWAVTSYFPDEILPYSIFIPPIILGYIASYLYLNKVSWLPICFRGASLTAHSLIPILCLVGLFFVMVIPDVATEYPLFRTILTILIGGVYYCNWTNKKTPKNFVVLRFLAQALVLVLVADLINYSFINYGSKSAERALIFSLTWAGSFFAQAIFSLFTKRKTKEEKDSENTAGIISLIGIGTTLLASSGMTDSQYGTVASTVLIILAILGIMYATNKKNLDWLFASLVAFVILPIILADLVFSDWTTDTTFWYFTCLSIITVLTHILTMTQDKVKALRFSIWSISVSSFIALCAASDFKFVSLATLVPTLSFWALSFITKNKTYVQETSIYLSGLTLLHLTQDIIEVTTSCSSSSYLYSSCYNNALDLQKFIQLNIAGLTFALTSFLYDKHVKGAAENKQVRLTIGYILFTFFGSLVALFAYGDQDNMVIGLIFLLEQAIILALASFTQKRWLAITSGIVIVVGGLYMTDLYKHTYIWLIMLGIALVGLVVWRLVAMNNKDKKKVTQNSTTPSIPSGNTATPAPEVNIEPTVTATEIVAENIIEDMTEVSESTTSDEVKEDNVDDIQTDLIVEEASASSIASDAEEAKKD